ncbi:MAG: hypothetical protein IT174_03270 [Acidobacteria bacterium]|nr:hypothetical protein [Acidobacteriota bacterium]
MPHLPVERSPNGASPKNGMSGYSLVEIVVVVALLCVLTAMSLPYFFNFSRTYKSEDQAIKVMDLMREAGQIALTQRRTIRLEIDRSDTAAPFIRMSEEGGAVLKTIPLEPLNSVRMDVAPAGINAPSPPNYAAASYVSNVWAIRFRSNGSVVTAAGTTPVSATLFSWRPKMETGTPFNISDLNPARPEEVRAVTIYGGTGAVRYWKYTGSAWVPYQ